jgi:tripartite-type tricarboxylate transporter receptor subunit TctC
MHSPNHARRTLLRAMAAAPALGALPTHAFAQGAWPQRALRIIVPFAPGGTSDVIARLISKPLQDALGQSVIVENRAGAAGVVGTAAVAQATDDHTVLLSDVGTVAINPLVNSSLPYKPADLQGVTMLAYSPHLLAAHPSVQANNLKELVALSKTTRLNVASAGSGSPNHLGVVEIALATGMKWQHVPYKGGAQALADTVAGSTQLLLNGMVATLPQVQSGKLKVIGVSKRTRVALLANAPTIAEQGVTNFESGTYQGVLAPVSMPKAAVAALNAALIAVIRNPDMRARLVAAGAEVTTSTPGEITQFMQGETKRWGAVIQRAGKAIEGTG